MAVELTTVADDAATFHDGTDVDHVGDLEPGTEHERHGITFRTLERPTGRLRCRFGTVNDVHFGETEAGRIEDLTEGPIRRVAPGRRAVPGDDEPGRRRRDGGGRPRRRRSSRAT